MVSINSGRCEKVYIWRLKFMQIKNDSRKKKGFHRNKRNLNTIKTKASFPYKKISQHLSWLHEVKIILLPVN